MDWKCELGECDCELKLKEVKPKTNVVKKKDIIKKLK